MTRILRQRRWGVNGPKTGPTLGQLLLVNTDSGQPVRPSRIDKTRNEWHATPVVEFHVDFEFCSDLNDDFSTLPEKGGQPLIFMIGCGHLEKSEWRFKSLVANRLTEEEELRIIREWVAHMSAVRGPARPRQREAAYHPLVARRTNRAIQRLQFG